MPASTTSKWGLGREEQEAQVAVLFKNRAAGGTGCSAFLRIGPEHPARGQSELTWASKPDCGIATTRNARTQDTARTVHRTKDGMEIDGCKPSPSGDRQPEP